jgi:hypothetical protein
MTSHPKHVNISAEVHPTLTSCSFKHLQPVARCAPIIDPQTRSFATPGIRPRALAPAEEEFEAQRPGGV